MQEPCGSPAHAAAPSGSTADVFAAFLRLGLASLGGPIAHLGCFHEEFVVRRKWLDEKTYVGPSGAVAISAGAGEQQGQHRACGYRSPAMRGRWPPGLVIAFCAIGGAALTFVPFGH